MKREKRERISLELVKEALKEKGSFLFDVKGGSMFPFLLDGDRVVIKRVSIDELGLGDIVMYARNNLMVVHRIVRINIKEGSKKVFILRGDNQAREDPPVSENEICGKVVKVMRGDIEFVPPSFHPVIVNYVRMMIDLLRRLKTLLGLNISQKDVIEILRRRR